MPYGKNLIGWRVDCNDCKALYTSTICHPFPWMAEALTVTKPRSCKVCESTDIALEAMYDA